MEKLNIDKVAELAHVSRSVVSRVLNNHPNVSDVARERVMKVVTKYNYRPNSVARQLATSSSHEIGVLVTQSGDEALGNAFWMEIHRGIFEESKKRGYFVSLSYVLPGKKDDLHKFILEERDLDGYILLTQEVTDMVGRRLFDKNIPIVLLGHVPKKKKVSSIDVDMKESEDRLEGFRKAHHDAGLEVEKQNIKVADYQFKAGYKAMEEWISSGADITAVFCASDSIAMGAILATREHGKKIPDDYAFVGFDDLSFAEYTCPPLTTIRQPIFEKGQKAAELLINEIESENYSRETVNLEPELVIRESCGARAEKAS